MSMPSTGRGAALFIPSTKNEKIRSARKLGKVSTTYVSIEASCPTTCALRKDKTCYAENGHVGMQVRRIEKRSPQATPRSAAADEAWSIDHAFHGGRIPQDGRNGGRDLRLHTSGDCRTPAAARVVAAAVERWKARGGGDVWTYTHAWKQVLRTAWKSTSVLASLDNASEAPLARLRGYAPARVVSEFPNGSKAWIENETRWIPCPAQTQENTGCADCRLCLDASALYRRNAGIAFAAHGARKNTLKRRLTVVS